MIHFNNYSNLYFINLFIITLIALIHSIHTQKYHHEDLEPKQDFSKIPGEPGKDYPIYHSIPQTGFSCSSVPSWPGIYANVETGCQVYHVCNDGREGDQGAAFLCSNGTLFNQHKFTCDWWYNVDCQQAISLYRLNSDPETNPYTATQKSNDHQDESNNQHYYNYYKYT